MGVDEVYLAQLEEDLSLLLAAIAGKWPATTSKMTGKLAAAVPVLIEEIRRLRSGIERLRQEHWVVPAWDEEGAVCLGNDTCLCGAAEHNAKAEALLNGG